MKLGRTPSFLLLAGAALLTLSTTLTLAATLPVSEDTFGFRATLTAAANKAKLLPVDATHTAYFYFNLADLPAAATIRYARLRIYLPNVVRPGSGLTIRKVTGSWDELAPSAEPAVDSTVIGTIPSAELIAKRFISVDLTATVQDWLTTPANNEGIAIASVIGATTAQTSSVSLCAKEGSGSGYLAELDVELNPGSGSIGSTQLATNLTLGGTTTGTFSGNGSALTNVTALTVADGAITSAKLANNAVGTAAIIDGSVTLAKLDPELADAISNLSPTLMRFVTVGNPGNAADPVTGLGAVAYTFQIGKYEVTNSQYVEFLNAVAATDTNGLYRTEMNTDAQSGAGILRSGSSGSYRYSVITGTGGLPVTYVGYADAIRFCNWLHNGKPTGAQSPSTTEDGAYTITLGTTVGARKNGAKYFLPTENEWVKAGYYDPAKIGGAGYWSHSTRSSAIPNSVNGSFTDTNAANFYYNDGIANGFNGGYAVTNSTTRIASQLYLMPVGSFPLSTNYYGTLDQTGNVEEIVEVASNGDFFCKGVSAFGDAQVLAANFRNPHNVLSDALGSGSGFRVARH